MSKAERRKLFQPIPLSTILDPIYQSPFPKMEQFQLDMKITSKNFQHNNQFNQPESLWKKFQTSLLNTMSNFVISPVFTPNRSDVMTLVPWKPYNNKCGASALPSEAVKPKHLTDSYPSLYHTIRNSLECLRYFASHPLQEEKFKQIDDCKQSNILLHQLSFISAEYTSQIPVMVQLPSFNSSFTALSRIPEAPSPNLFSLAMTGLLLAIPRHMNLNVFYNNCFVSPQFKGAAMLFQSELCSTSVTSSNFIPKDSDSIEIVIHSTSNHRQEIDIEGKMSNSCTSISTPSPTMEINSNAAATEAGCILIETNWRTRNDSSGHNDNRTNFHAVSVCSTTSGTGSALTFSCSSTMNTSPQEIAANCLGIERRGKNKTESESSTESFIEFSASVDSTDSFCIVFESAPGGCMDKETYVDDEEWGENDDYDDDEEDQAYIPNSEVYDLDEDGPIFMTDLDGLMNQGGTGMPAHDQMDKCTPHKPKIKIKTVSFDEDHLTNVIEFEDDLESKNARETYWESCARDRVRFQDRIERTEDIVSSILLPAHRFKVFAQRFAD